MAAGLADASAKTTTKHTGANVLIFKVVEVVTLVFLADKNASVAQRRLSAFSGYCVLEICE